TGCESEFPATSKQRRTHMSNTLAMIASAAVALGVNASAALAADTAKVKSVVLVHGGFVDGSGWEAVWGVQALEGKVTTPAWKTKPSWYLVSTDDRMIPPAAQRQMASRAGSITVETPGSHAIYVSNPAAVANLIQQAAAKVPSN